MLPMDSVVMMSVELPMSSGLPPCVSVVPLTASELHLSEYVGALYP